MRVLKFERLKAIDEVLVNNSISAETKLIMSVMRDQISKELERKRPPTPRQQENVIIKEHIFQNMEDGIRYTCDEISQWDFSSLSIQGITKSRIQSLLTQLYKDGRIDREATVRNGTKYFKD